MIKRRPRLIHDHDCAVIREVAVTVDEELGHYEVPVCTCKDRQKARLRRSLIAGGGRRIEEMLEGLQPLGGGNYIHGKLFVDY